MQNLLILLISLGVVSALGCGSNKKSQRDARREQIRSQSDAKRKELGIVTGRYYGFLTSNDRRGPGVTLNLETKDVAQEEEGEFDPILVPTLSGYLKINYSADTNNQNEQISFNLSTANYDAKEGRLNIIGTHGTYKNINMTLVEGDSDTLVGNWSAPESSVSGDITLYLSNGTGGQAQLTEFTSSSLAGKYHGNMTWEGEDAYQRVIYTVVPTLDSGNDLKLSVSAKLIFGELNSVEYLTYEYNEVDFNPLTEKIILSKANSEYSFVGTISGGEINGDWSSISRGQMGVVTLSKLDPVKPAPSLILLQKLGGTYRGVMKNTNSQSNLPPRVQVSFVTNRDITEPNGIKISGNIRFYLGEFDSEEYIERVLKNVNLNFFTRELVAATGGENPFTFLARINLDTIKGTLSHDALGEVATLEVTRL